MSQLALNIKSLFDQIASFEAGASGFNVRVFMSTLDGVLSNLETLKPEILDQALHDQVSQPPPTQRPLRRLVANTLGMFLELRTHGSGPHRLLARETLLRQRDEGERADVDFIEQALLPSLLDVRSLNDNVSLGLYLLRKLAMFLEASREPRLLPERGRSSDLQGVALPRLLLEFVRRNLPRSAQPPMPIDVPGSLEYTLDREGFFDKLCGDDRWQGLDIAPYLRRLGLKRALPLWRRVLATLRRLFDPFGVWLNGVFERLPGAGTVSSAVWIILAVAIMIAVPILWILHYKDRVSTFERRSVEMQEKTLEVSSGEQEEEP